MNDFDKGRYVTFTDDPRFPGVYQIASEGPANFKLTRVAGGRGVMVPKRDASRVLRTATAEQVREAEAARPAVEFKAYMIVTYQHPQAAGHLYIVMKVRTDGTLDLMKLGGHSRYYASVLPALATLVPAAEIEDAFRKAGGALS